MTKTGKLDSGTKVGTYRIGDLIGEGGMGHVYRAFDSEGQEVALKMVRSDIAANNEFRRRFGREARAAKKVNDSHVVAVIDEGEHEGMPYLVQEFIPGGSLAQRLEAERRLGLAEAVRVCRQVAAGLGAMHRSGLVHRDVKPGNILLDLEGRAYIADFGLVKEQRASVLTQPGQAVGSVDYMAPEQVRGVEVSAATDTYALGCVIYECLTGSAPFANRTGMRVMWAHLQDEPANPCDERPDLPAELGVVVCRALHKNPEERPPTPIAYARVMQVAAGLPPTGVEV